MLTLMDLITAFTIPRTDHPGRKGAPFNAGGSLLSGGRGQTIRRKVPRVRRSRVLEMIAARDRSRVVTQRHRRIYNATKKQMRREAISKRRAAA